MSEVLSKEIIAGIFSVIVVSVPILLSYSLNKKKKDKKIKRESSMHLAGHPVFSRLHAHKIYIKTIFCLPSASKGKEIALRELLTNYLDIWLNGLTDLANTMEECCSACKDDEQSSCNDLYNVNMKAVSKARERFYDFYTNTASYSPDEQKVLKIMGTKFDKWIEPQARHIESRITMLCNSKFYGDCHTRQAVIFDMYIGVFSELMNDVERTLLDINGDLRGLTYKGVPIV